MILAPAVAGLAMIMDKGRKSERCDMFVLVTILF